MNKDKVVPLRVNVKEDALINALQEELHLPSRSEVLRQGLHALNDRLHPPSQKSGLPVKASQTHE
jgi:hypothetical protein